MKELVVAVRNEHIKLFWCEREKRSSLGKSSSWSLLRNSYEIIHDSHPWSELNAASKSRLHTRIFIAANALLTFPEMLPSAFIFSSIFLLGEHKVEWREL